MTQLPFEDLPPPQQYAATGFTEFYAAYPRKVGPRRALAAYLKAIKRAGHGVIIAGLERYKRNKPAYCDWMHPTTFLNGDHWEDEYDTPRSSTRYGPKTDKQLRQIAEYVKKPFYEFGAYPRETLQACVDAGLLTQEEMEAKS